MTTLFPKLQNALEEVGLSKTEALVYLATLELGAGSILEISNKCGVKRPTCYVVLDELIRQGFASKTDDGKRSIYIVEPPEELLRVAKHRVAKFEALSPEFDALASRSTAKPIVRLYEGKAGIKQAYALTLSRPPGEELLFIGTGPNVRSAYKEPDEYIENRLKRKLKARAILTQSPLAAQIGRDDAAEARRTRVIPAEKYKSNVEIIIFGQAVAYIAHAEDRPFATIIENAAIADEERQRFELLWDQARPV